MGAWGCIEEQSVRLDSDEGLLLLAGFLMEGERIGPDTEKQQVEPAWSQGSGADSAGRQRASGGRP